MELNVFLRLLLLICLFLPRLAIKLNQATEANSNANSTNACSKSECQQIVLQTDICSIAPSVMMKKCPSYCERCKNFTDDSKASLELIGITSQEIVKLDDDDRALLDQVMIDAFTEVVIEKKKKEFISLIDTSLLNIKIDTIVPPPADVLSDEAVLQINDLDQRTLEVFELSTSINFSSYHLKDYALLEALKDMEFEQKLFNRRKDALADDNIVAGRIFNGFFTTFASLAVGISSFSNSVRTRLNALKLQTTKNAVAASSSSSLCSTQASCSLASTQSLPSMSPTQSTSQNSLKSTQSVPVSLLSKAGKLFGTGDFFESLLTSFGGESPNLVRAQTMVASTGTGKLISGVNDNIDQMRELHRRGLYATGTHIDNIRKNLAVLKAHQQILGNDIKKGINTIMLKEKEQFFIFMNQLNDVSEVVNNVAFNDQKFRYIRDFHSKTINLKTAMEENVMAMQDEAAQKQMMFACQKENEPINVLETFASLLNEFLSNLRINSNGNFAKIRPMIRIILRDTVFLNMMVPMCLQIRNYSLLQSCKKQEDSTKFTVHVIQSISNFISSYDKQSHEVVHKAIDKIVKNEIIHSNRNQKLHHVILTKIARKFPELRFLVYIPNENSNFTLFSELSSYVHRVQIIGSTIAATIYWHSRTEEPVHIQWDRCHDGNTSQTAEYWYSTKPKCVREGLIVNKKIKECSTKWCDIAHGETIPSCENKSKIRIKCFKDTESISGSKCYDESFGCYYSSFNCRKQRISNPKSPDFNTTIFGEKCLKNGSRTSFDIEKFAAPVCIIKDNTTNNSNLFDAHQTRNDCSIVINYPEPFSLLKKIYHENKENFPKNREKNWISYDAEKMGKMLSTNTYLINIGACVHGVITQSSTTTYNELNYATNMNSVSETPKYIDRTLILNLNKQILSLVSHVEMLQKESKFYEDEILSYISIRKKDLIYDMLRTLQKNKKYVLFNLTETIGSINSSINLTRDKIKNMEESGGEIFDSNMITKENDMYIRQIFIMKSCPIDFQKRIKFPTLAKTDICLKENERLEKILLNAETQLARFFKLKSNKLKSDKVKKLLTIILPISALLLLASLAVALFALHRRRRYQDSISNVSAKKSKSKHGRLVLKKSMGKKSNFSAKKSSKKLVGLTKQNISKQTVGGIKQNISKNYLKISKQYLSNHAAVGSMQNISKNSGTIRLSKLLSGKLRESKQKNLSKQKSASKQNLTKQNISKQKSTSKQNVSEQLSKKSALKSTHQQLQNNFGQNAARKVSQIQRSSNQKSAGKVIQRSCKQKIAKSRGSGNQQTKLL